MRHRPFRADCNPPLDGLNYAQDRPFRSWAAAHLNAALGGWLQLDPPCLELATLALEELTLRGDDLNARMKFAAVDLEPIIWLSNARKRVREYLLEEAAKKTGKGNVYVVLRGGYTETSGWYGAYVGSTRKTLKTRFLEHRKGVRAARGLPVHGIEPLYSLCLPLNPLPSGPGLREWETRLHECLAPVIPKVTGDVAF